MTGKKSARLPSLNDSKRQALIDELARHEAAIANLEEQGNFNTWHHEAAARIRAALQDNFEELENDKLD